MHKKIINKISKKIINVIGKGKHSLHEPTLGDKEKNFVLKCLKSGFVSSAGKMIGKFEKEIKKVTKSKHVISVINCTEAIKVCLKVAGVRENDEVLVPSLTFVGSVSPIVEIGAIPHFIDSNLDDLGVNVEKLSEYLKKNTFLKKGKLVNKKTKRCIKAIIPVHIFGHSCKIVELLKLSKKFKIFVIEDAAEALGSFYKKKHLGTFGLAGCISFNGNKIITTGSGGAIITNNYKFAKKAKHLIQTAKVKHKFEYVHDEIGYNLRMSNLNASLGLGQMKNLRKFLNLKRKLFFKYKKYFADCKEFEIFSERKFSRSNYWLQTIILKKNYINLKNHIIKDLHKKKILARPAWKLISTLKPYKNFPKMNLSGAKHIYSSVINLPSSPGILLKK